MKIWDSTLLIYDVYIKIFKCLKYHILKYSKDEQIKHLYAHILCREQKRKHSIPSLKHPPRKKPYKCFSGPLELERLEGIVACDNLTRNAQSDWKGLGYASSPNDRDLIIAVRKEEAEHKLESSLAKLHYAG